MTALKRTTMIITFGIILGGIEISRCGTLEARAATNVDTVVDHRASAHGDTMPMQCPHAAAAVSSASPAAIGEPGP